MIKELIKKLDILAEKRFDITNYKITSQWLIGFIEAEGSFLGKKGQQASFHISQHLSDWYLMEAIAKYIGYGKIRSLIRNDGRSEAILRIYNKEILRNKIIPMCQGNFKSIKKNIQFNE